jgi:hypothetical protein
MGMGTIPRTIYPWSTGCVPSPTWGTSGSLHGYLPSRQPIDPVDHRVSTQIALHMVLLVIPLVLYLPPSGASPERVGSLRALWGSQDLSPERCTTYGVLLRTPYPWVQGIGSYTTHGTSHYCIMRSPGPLDGVHSRPSGTTTSPT